jgi:hypothetical protein
LYPYFIIRFKEISIKKFNIFTVFKDLLPTVFEKYFSDGHKNALVGYGFGSVINWPHGAGFRSVILDYRSADPLEIFTYREHCHVYGTYLFLGGRRGSRRVWISPGGRAGKLTSKRTLLNQLFMFRFGILKTSTSRQLQIQRFEVEIPAQQR